MNIFSNLLSVRALNHWRVYSIPTYLGLRVFLKQVPESKRSSFLTEFLLNKMSLRESGRYRYFPRFKGMSPSGVIERRDMYAASPSTALAEAYTLHMLSELDAFRNRPYVYSNQWPDKKNASRSFSYFYSGYSRRNKHITSVLQENPDLIVVANDIRSFYPSIDRNTVLGRLTNRLDGKNQTIHHKFIEDVSHQLITCDDKGKGVPVGPALSHVLADLALENVDREMYSLLKDRYSRYVDDIILLVNKDEVANVQAKLTELLSRESLDLNLDKHDELPASEWFAVDSSPYEVLAAEEFSRLLDNIKVYIWDRPNKAQELSEAFRKKGIAMPIQRFAIDADYGRYRKYIKYLSKSNLVYKQMIQDLEHVNTMKILSDASVLFSKFYELGTEIAKENSSSPNEHKLVIKMRSQKLRFLLSRLLYLTSIHDYEELLYLTPKTVEFKEYRNVVNSLITGSIDELVNTPGPAVSTFASMFNELGLGSINLDLKNLRVGETIDSLATLAAFGIFRPSEDWILQLSPIDREYFNFCIFKPAKSRTLKDFSYEDEMRSLQLNIDDPELRRLLMTTRFSDTENINLDALRMSAEDS